MNDKITSFGKWCRKLRVDKGLSMSAVAGKLGKKQNHITQIEQGQANPSIEFLKECLTVYEIPKAEKPDFIAQALTSSERIVLELDKITIIPKEDLARLLAVLVFNLEDSPDTTEWYPVTKAINELLYAIRHRSNNKTR